MGLRPTPNPEQSNVGAGIHLVSRGYFTKSSGWKTFCCPSKGSQNWCPRGRRLGSSRRILFVPVWLVCKPIRGRRRRGQALSSAQDGAIHIHEIWCSVQGVLNGLMPYSASVFPTTPISTFTFTRHPTTPHTHARTPSTARGDEKTLGVNH